MARDFNGTNEHLDFGTDASIDDFITRSIAFWVVRRTAGADVFLAKSQASSPGAWQMEVGNSGNGSRLGFWQRWSGGAAFWEATTALATSTLYHVALVYDGGATGNDPTFYVNGSAEALTSNGSPTGTLTSDAAFNLLSGENAAGASDFDGQLQNLNYVNALWDAAQVNRARWWGRPGGAQAVYHPWFTTKLANEGTATADGTATGTAMASLPRVMRPGCGGW